MLLLVALLAFATKNPAPDLLVSQPHVEKQTQQSPEQSAQYYLSAAQVSDITDISRVNDYLPQIQVRIVELTGNNLRIHHKTKTDLSIFEKFQIIFTRKLAYSFYDGYYIYQLRKLLI